MASTEVPEKLVVTRWRCPHCNRSRSSKSVTIAHMSRCWRNPAARSCKTCANHVPDASEPEVGYVAPECCDAGIDLPFEEDPQNPYPINCPKWEVAV